MSMAVQKNPMTSRLLWKELRTQGLLWIAIFAMSAILMISVFQFGGELSAALVFYLFVFVATSLYALASGAIAFASEDESKTIGLLRNLPLSSRDVLWTKLGFGFAGTVLFFVFFYLITWIVAAQRWNTREFIIPFRLDLVFLPFEALIWSAIFSMRTRSVLAGAIWGGLLVIVISLVTASLALGRYSEITWAMAYVFRAGLLIGACLYLPSAADCWFSDFDQAGRRTRFGAFVRRLTHVPLQCGRILWLAWRENKWVLFVAAGFIVCMGLLFFLNLQQDRWIRLERSVFIRDYSYYQNLVGKLVPSFYTTAVLSVITSFLCAVLGLVVFGTPRQLRSAAILSHRGISSRLVVGVRVLLFGGLAAFMGYLLEVVSLTSVVDGNARWDGLKTMEFFVSTAAWSFVATYWSSFWTRTKILALLAGLIVGLFGSAVYFVFTILLIDRTGFDWLRWLVILVPIGFAPLWANPSRGMMRNFACWLLFPLAIVGLYGATAWKYQREIDRYQSVDLVIPKPSVPEVKLEVAPERISVPSILMASPDETGPYRRFLQHDGSVGNPRGIHTSEMENWLKADKGSVEWDVKRMDMTEELFRVFEKFEPTIAWARDRLLANDCVVDFSASPGPQDNWLIVGAYKKLKESNAEESLAYALAAIRSSQNMYYYRFARRLGGEQLSSRDIGTAENLALEFLPIWAQHPSVRTKPELISKAIDAIPDSDPFRPLWPYSVLVWQKETRQAGDGIHAYYDQLPIDFRAFEIANRVFPWRERKNKRKLDYDAAEMYQLIREGKELPRKSDNSFLWEFKRLNEVSDSDSETRKRLETTLKQIESNSTDGASR